MELGDIVLDDIERIQVGKTRVHEFEKGEAVPREVNFRDKEGLLVARGVETNSYFNEDNGAHVVSYRITERYDSEPSLAWSL